MSASEPDVAELLESLEPVRLWQFVPPEAALPDPVAWAEATAADMARELSLTDPDAPERLAAMLLFLAAEEIPDPFAWRFLFMVDPDVGGAVYHVAFLDPEGGEARQAAWAQAAAQVAAPGVPGAWVEDFTLEGLAGSAYVGFEVLDPPEPLPTGESLDHSPLAVHVQIVVRRDLPGLGVTDVLADCRTCHLESAVMSLDPARHLLCAPGLADLVAGAAT